jgi:hypothetical protein
VQATLHRRMAQFLWLAMGAATPAAAADSISFEVMGGSAINVPTPLTIHQNGYPDIELNAHYDTKPFGPEAPYYAWRVSDWSADEAWEFGQIHHRLFLSNPPPEVQYFAIHYGYNYFFLGRGWKRSGWVFHLGVGPIVTNPQSSVRHKVQYETGGLFDTGSHFSGMGSEAAVEKDFYFAKHAFFVVEAAMTAGWAWSVPVADGSANVPNLAFHGHIGVGGSF